MIKSLMDREKEVTERLKAKSAETVDVLKPKKQAAEKALEALEKLTTPAGD